MAPVSRCRPADDRLPCGVEIGADGPSQMGLEDLAMIAALQGSTVLYPSDAHLHRRSRRSRWRRPAGSATCAPPAADTRCCTRQRSEFPVGGSKTLAESADDAVTLIGAGRDPPPGAGSAADTLAEQGTRARRRSTPTRSSRSTPRASVTPSSETGGRVVVAEDHHAEGGLGRRGPRRPRRRADHRLALQPSRGRRGAAAPGPPKSFSTGPGSTRPTSPKRPAPPSRPDRPVRTALSEALPERPCPRRVSSVPARRCSMSSSSRSLVSGTQQ